MNLVSASTSSLFSVWISLLCIVLIIVVEDAAASGVGVSSSNVEQGAIIFTKFMFRKLWNHGTNNEIVSFWGCREGDREDASVIPTEEVWRYLRYTYERTTNRTARSPTADENALDGFHVDIDIELHPIKGRGLVTRQAVSAGEMVYRPIYSVAFRTGEEYRRYLQALPPYLVCDIINWSYIRYNEEQEPMICVDLDAASMVNECDTDEECTLMPAKGMGRFTGCHLELVAERDIAEGEELAMNYDFSEGPSGWVPLGLFHPEDADDSQTERAIKYYEEAARRYESDEF
eukprot:Nitzschia sp. Nitz4//scaffold98_size77359//71351//72217//NITZ4_005560-RA/size77359-processed-gene-0.133-mRNA-1//1//CDS//3329560793//4314//frame0